MLLARVARTAAVRAVPVSRIAAPSTARLLSTASTARASESSRAGTAAVAALALTFSYAAYETRNRFALAEAAKTTKTADWDKIRKEIADSLSGDHDDGSYGPVLIRLAWHASGTFDKYTHKGGSNGAHMRFKQEAGWGANAGLNVARDFLETIKARHPEISYADLWTFAAVVAIEEMGGPKIPWRPGRTDAKDHTTGGPDGTLPDADKGPLHIRQIFYRMGFDDREIVALIGAHTLGRCHPKNSGYEGPWTRAPTSFTNEFFRELVENKWTIRKWNGPAQYTDPTGDLMMLPADMAFLEDPDFKKYVILYAYDQDAFFADFARAFGKLLELGVPRDEKK